MFGPERMVMGRPRGANCSEWTSNAGFRSGTMGQLDLLTQPEWSNDGTTSCSNDLRIYCVEQ